MGKNGATGLMQVVPSAHRPLLKNVKDLTEPDTNIEVGTAILYGYMKSAGGNLDVALKSYGGSQAYAEMVGLRVKSFASVVESQEVAGARWQAAQMGACDTRWTTICIGTVAWPGAASDALESARAPLQPPLQLQAISLPGALSPLAR